MAGMVGGREKGFTYLGLIVAVAIIGLVGAATLKVDALLRRAAAEQELLEIGAAFSEALRSYADATPRGQPALPPPSLQDLLKDPRYPGVKRHLRKIFVDPITGTAQWGIVYANNPNGRSTAGDGIGVLAVYSLSQAKPLKVANFDARFENLDNKQHLSDWKFAASGQALAQAASHAAPNQASAGAAMPGQAPAQSLFGSAPSAPSPNLPAPTALSAFTTPPASDAPAAVVDTPPELAAPAQAARVDGSVLQDGPGTVSSEDGDKP